VFVICALIAIVIVGPFSCISAASKTSRSSTHPLSGLRSVLGQLREETFKLLDPRWNAVTSTVLFYVYLPVRTIVDPFIVAALFDSGSLEGNAVADPVRDRLRVAGFYAASSLARAPLAALVLRMLLVFYVLRMGSLTWRAVAGWTLAILAFPVLVTAAAYRPGPPPTDCGPAAGRGPEIGKAPWLIPTLR